MRSFSFVLLAICFLLSGCSGMSRTEERSQSMLYNFNEPVRFPFEVNDVRTEIAIDNPDTLHQYVFHYKNKQTTQEIKYILSKVIDDPEEIREHDMQPVELNNGKRAYYQEDETSQSIWWDGDNGFLARFVYYMNGNLDPLDAKNKLAQSDLIDLVNQVQ